MSRLIPGEIVLQSGQDVQIATDKRDEALLEAALNAFTKALKAMNFYPPEHPLRDESIASAMVHLQPLLAARELVLTWSRDGCTLSDRTPVKNSSTTARTLARELLTRKLQRLIILPELSISDLKSFLAIITSDPAKVEAAGGIEAAMLKAGIKTIGANEVDLSLLRGASQEGSEIEAAALAPSGEETAEDEESGEETPEESMPLTFSMMGIDILLGMLKVETRDPQFLQLARELIDAAEEIKRREEFATLLPILDPMLEIHANEERTSAQREYIRYSLEQIINGGMTTYLLDRIEERTTTNEIMLDKLCATIGQSLAYPLIQRLCVTESLHARKTIAIALTRAGEAAISALVSMLKDERWYVVRNMVTILGEILSSDSLRALQQTANHPEPKVRKEVVKSLVKFASLGGERTLVAMLDDPEKDVVRQVIFSLGAIRSKAAVAPLLDIVMASDAFLNELELKKLAVASLGKIGDRQATEPLLDLLHIRGWLAPRRWLELKTATATALGQLGDENALPSLKRLSRHDSTFGMACSDAADNIERVVK